MKKLPTIFLHNCFGYIYTVCCDGYWSPVPYMNEILVQPLASLSSHVRYGSHMVLYMVTWLTRVDLDVVLKLTYRGAKLACPDLSCSFTLVTFF